MKYKVYWIIAIAFALGCKKDSLIDNDAPISPTTGTRKQFTLDSIFLYARQTYLWNEALPSYADFDPRNRYAALSPDLKAFKQELFDISQLKLNPLTGKAYEFLSGSGWAKYSYMQQGALAGQKTAGTTVATVAVLEKKLIQQSGKTVAYLAVGAFPSLNSCKAELDVAFTEFSATQPEDLVIDLRSNTGGYVETAEYLANLIVPSALNGKLMYSEQYNPLMQSGKAVILKHQPYLDSNGKTVLYNGRLATMADVDYTEAVNSYKFSKKGKLESVKNIYFIVSNRTASASEMLISCMKPYFKVVLAGEPTYGKPVGFFGIQVAEYIVYLSGFLIRNADGWSDYFNGMGVDIAVAPTSNAVLGDSAEPCLGAVLASINGHAISAVGYTGIKQNRLMNIPSTLNDAETPEGAEGMIENRLKFKSRN
uniref:S41 family peptidase n=1 Tax=Pedobacter schmidteae TaxID=2201271 RepID=UPI000EAF45FF|nr:S41 family peptidase [Pedobacter schmidteae]